MENQLKRVNERITIKLPSNVSTGYEWTIQKLQNLRLINKYTQSSCKTPTPGCGGYTIYIVEGIQKGPASFSALYARSWETTPSDHLVEYSYIIV